HVNYYDDQTDNYLQINNQLIFNHTFSNRWSANVTGFYTYGNGYYKQYKDDAWTVGYDNLNAGVSQADLIREKKMRNNRYGLNATGRYAADELELIFGTSLSYYAGPHYGTIDWINGVDENIYKDFQWYSNDVTKGDYNVFAKAIWTPFEDFNVFADLQYRRVDYKIDGVNDNYDWNNSEMQPINVDENYNFFNPHFGVKYQVAPKHDVYASFAASSKEPTRSDFTDRYNFSSLTDEPKPEHLYDFELGYDFTGSVLSFNANFYYMIYKDQLVPTGIVNDSDDNLNINVPDSYRRGVEIIADVKAAKWLTLGGSATASDNRIKDYVENISGVEFEMGDTKIAYSPSLIASAYADFRMGDFSALLRGQFVGKQYMGNGNFDDLSLPSYFVADLNLGYQISDNVKVGLLINNLLNREYFSYGYGGSWLNGSTLDTRDSWAYFFPQAKFNALANITVNF
nr:TonB-dependent receptor [Bacteroidales bacterium]